MMGDRPVWVTCSWPGCQNEIQIAAPVPRDHTVTIFCVEHRAPEPERAWTSENLDRIRTDAPPPTADADSIIAAIVDAAAAINRIRDWNEQIADVAKLVADPHREHGIIIQISRANNRVDARADPAIPDRTTAYVFDLDHIDQAPARGTLTDHALHPREDTRS